MGDKKQQQPRQLPMFYHGLFGGTSGAIGICILQPADLIKTRMQLKGKNASMVGTIMEVIKNEGFLRLYTGVSCSVFRQYTYGLTRFFMYYNLFETYRRKYGEPPILPLKMVMGCFSGMCGAVVGTPAEVCLIRITGDGLLPPEKRRNYSHVFNALYRISKEEGIGALWRGVEATVMRAAVVNAFELAAYSQSREMLLPYFGEGVPLHAAASMVAGFAATVSSLPVDIIKTRVQQSRTGNDSQFTILKDIVRNEGVLKLWSGFIPTYIKLGPHALFTFVFLEQFIILYWKMQDSMEPKYA